MSLRPLFFANDWYPSSPSSFLNQHFGVGLDMEDLLVPTTIHRHIPRFPVGYLRTWTTPALEKDVGSTVVRNADTFQVNLDVQQFKPEEISVKYGADDNTITVEGKHEEKEDEHGTVYRHFIRSYTLPKGHDINAITSNLSSDGVLSITAPKINKPAENERAIPINQTGVPSKPIAQKKTDEKQ